MGSPFKNRTLSVINDLTADEQFYLYQKSGELKQAIFNNENVDAFRVGDSESSYYLIFLEDSTRTKESFRNASLFHRGRVNVFEAGSSSFNKNESITDTVRMLMGYSGQSTFIIRSKQEGLCRWLDHSMKEYALNAGINPPVFINAGDGKHEHPTQELLDEFTFLEQMDWDRSKIHIALVGDLFHGRTVHSKVDGLRVFKEVIVDLVAPKELSLPPHYIERMKKNGYTVNVFSSIDDYINQNKTADVWYFTRLQLERMGDEVREKASSLRRAVTFRKEFIPMLAGGTRFYHPLPRHREYPVIPTFLDSTPLNGWDQQSVNGYYTRIMEIALLNGVMGDDFKGEVFKAEEHTAEFIEEVNVTNHAASDKDFDYKVGIKPVEQGIVIDHIARGSDIEEIWSHIDKVRRIMGFNYRSSHGVYHCNDRALFKGIISLPDILSFNDTDLKMLAAISPGCTLNLIENAQVIKKFRLHSPPRVYGFSEISCKNPSCISHPDYFEPIEPDFYRSETGRYICRYCEKPHHYSEIWDI